MIIKEKICKDPDCDNTFKQYNSLQKYCSYSCDLKNKKEKLRVSPKRIRKISSKQSKLLQRYVKIRAEFLSQPENKYCPVTGLRTMEIHHKMGKIGFADDWAREFDVPLLIDERYFLGVNRIGHNKIEANPEWAYKNNYSEKRNK